VSVLEVARRARCRASDPDAYLLADRLGTGWIMCDRETDPVRKDQLEDHWLRLLHEYEDACDRAAAVSE